MLKVLLLASWYPKGPQDSSGIFIQDQVKALAGHVDLRVHSCEHRMKGVPGRWQDAWIGSRIRRQLSREGWAPDLIHAHVAYPAGKIGSSLKRAFGVPVVLTEHTGPLSLLERYFASEAGFNAHFGSYDRILAVSSFLRDEIVRRSPASRVEVVPNLVADGFLKGEWSGKAPQTSACFVGRATEDKGVPELLAALDAYDRGGGPKLDFHFIGNGPLRLEVERRGQIWKNVRLTLGEGGRDQVRAALESSAFLVLPSRVETFSLVAAEALSLGKPVLGFECGGPADFVADERGLLLSDRSPEGLAARIREFATDSRWKFTVEIAEKRREFCRARFSSEVISRRLLEVYASLG